MVAARRLPESPDAVTAITRTASRHAIKGLQRLQRRSCCFRERTTGDSHRAGCALRSHQLVPAVAGALLRELERSSRGELVRSCR